MVYSANVMIPLCPGTNFSYVSLLCFSEGEIEDHPFHWCTYQSAASLKMGMNACTQAQG